MSISSEKSSPRQKSAARLYAVQAVYQMQMNGQPAAAVLEDFFASRIDRKDDVDLPDLATPEGALFKAIVEGVERQRDNLNEAVGKNLKAGLDLTALQEKEPLIYAILLCGAFELMAHTSIDAPIIMADYLNVTHSYYQGKESSIINGVLDSLTKLYR